MDQRGKEIEKELGNNTPKDTHSANGLSWPQILSQALTTEPALGSASTRYRHNLYTTTITYTPLTVSCMSKSSSPNAISSSENSSNPASDEAGC